MVGGTHKALAHRGVGGGGEDPSEESVDAATEEADVMFGRRGCCCIRLPRFGSSRSVPGGAWERIGDGGPPGAGTEAAGSAGAAWWRRALMRVREWSEIVAGPRWKTFIRRVNRNHRWGGGGGGGGGGGACGLCGIGGGGGGGAGGLCGIGGGGARSGKFQYDPTSYALNFDEGHGPDDDSDGDYGYRNFSARYVLPPSLAKTSVDVGGRDAPTLFSAT